MNWIWLFLLLAEVVIVGFVVFGIIMTMYRASRDERVRFLKSLIVVVLFTTATLVAFKHYPPLLFLVAIAWLSLGAIWMRRSGIYSELYRADHVVKWARLVVICLFTAIWILPYGLSFEETARKHPVVH